MTTNLEMPPKKPLYFVNKTPSSQRGTMDRGWGNGYVVVHRDNPAFGVGYDELDIVVNGGITYSRSVQESSQFKPQLLTLGIYNHPDYWVFGFDTAHYRDSLERWPKEEVIEETKRMLIQFIEMEGKVIGNRKPLKIMGRQIDLEEMIKEVEDDSKKKETKRS